MQKAGRREVPAGAIDRGVIRSPDTVVRVIASLLDELFGTRRGKIRAGVALPSALTFGQSFSFPAHFASEAAAKAAVAQAADTFPVPTAEMADDVLVSDGPDGRQVWYAVAPKEAIAQYLDVLHRAGVTPQFVDAEDQALCRGLGVVAPPQPVLLADIGERATLLVVADRHGVRMSASVPLGTERMVAALEAAHRLSLPQAAARLREKGFADGDVALQRPAAELLGELHRTAAFVASRWGQPVRAVVLCGGGSMIPRIAPFLEANMRGIPVGTGRPFRDIATGDRKSVV